MSPLEFAVLLLAAMAGGAVQSAIGFGAAVMTVPTLALVDADLLPAASLFAMFPLIATMSWRGRHDADLVGARRIILSRVPGVLVGAAIVRAWDTRAITVLVAVILLASVASMARGWSVPVTPTNQRVAGLVSGVTGTSTGLGGPPLALLYRDQAGAGMRATLSLAFLAGVVISLSTLAAVGEVAARQAAIGLPMGAATVVGLLLARGRVSRLSTETLRHGVLAWAAVGAVLAMGRALVP